MPQKHESIVKHSFEKSRQAGVSFFLRHPQFAELSLHVFLQTRVEPEEQVKVGPALFFVQERRVRLAALEEGFEIILNDTKSG